jgi:hypothetical protein
MLPKVKPVAPDTWEIRASLADADEESPRIDIVFPSPSTVVGAYCAVIQDSSNGGLLIPDLNDLLVLVDLDNQRRFTSGPTQGQSSAASKSSQYITLAALDSRVRDLYLNLASPRPVLGLTFRWKRHTAGTPIYEDAQISVALFVLPGTVTP